MAFLSHFHTLPASRFDCSDLYVRLTCVRISNCWTMCLRTESRLEGWPERTSSGCVWPRASSSLLPPPLPPPPPAPVWLPAIKPALPALWSTVHPSTLELATWRAGKPLEWWLLAAAWVGVKCVWLCKSWRWKRQKDLNWRSSASCYLSAILPWSNALCPTRNPR